MIKLIIQTLYLFLPALLANMTPVLVKNILKPLAKPVDFGRTFRGKRILGDHKTFRGLICGIIAGVLITGLQKVLFVYAPFEWLKLLSIIDYEQINFVLLGFLLGFGALFGDMVKSFFKRQFNILPGKPFIPFDQIDFLVGAILFLSIIYIPSWQMIIILLVLGMLLHFLTNIIGYLLKINKKWI